MGKFLVVSHDPDEQQTFWDTVVAETEEAAEKAVCDGRPYVIFAQAISQREVDSLSENMYKMSAAMIEKEFNEACGRDQICQNCRNQWREDELKEIEDLHERVSPGEPMPSGECPECGAVCHPIKKRRPK